MPQAAESESRRALAFEKSLTNDDFEAAFRRDYPLVWLSTLIGPFALTGGLFALVYVIDLLEGSKYFWKLIGAASGSFFLLGKFIILFGSDSEALESAKYFLTSGKLFVMLVYMDIMTAVLLTFHTGFLFRFPVIGHKLHDLVQDGQFILKTNPWMKRATFIGTVAFVMFPVAATGSIGGSIFGRLLGMSRPATLLAITIGSVLGCGAMYYGAVLIPYDFDPRSEGGLVRLIGGIACIAALVLFLNYRYRRMKASHLAEETEKSRVGKVES